MTFLFFIKQELSALVVGCLPLNVGEADLHDTEKCLFQNGCHLSKGPYTTLREKKSLVYCLSVCTYVAYVIFCKIISC